MDQHKNFARSAIAVAPSPATSGVTATLTTGDGAIMPTVPFQAVVYPNGQRPSLANAEIVRVTAMAGDAITTMARAQEGTVARAIGVGDIFLCGITAKMIQDIEADLALRAPALNPVLAGTTTAPLIVGAGAFGGQSLVLKAAPNATLGQMDLHGDPARPSIRIRGDARTVIGTDILSGVSSLAGNCQVLITNRDPTLSWNGFPTSLGCGLVVIGSTAEIHRVANSIATPVENLKSILDIEQGTGGGGQHVAVFGTARNYDTLFGASGSGAVVAAQFFGYATVNTASGLHADGTLPFGADIKARVGPGVTDASHPPLAGLETGGADDSQHRQTNVGLAVRIANQGKNDIREAIFIINTAGRIGGFEHGLVIGTGPHTSIASNWVANGTYGGGEVVAATGGFWLCKAAVTGSATPPASDATHWVSVPDAGPPAWAALNRDHDVHTVVSAAGALWVCAVAHGPSYAAPNNTSATSPTSDRWNGYSTNAGTSGASAPAWSSLGAYLPGDVVTNAGHWWLCKVANGPTGTIPVAGANWTDLGTSAPTVAPDGSVDTTSTAPAGHWNLWNNDVGIVDSYVNTGLSTSVRTPGFPIYVGPVGGLGTNANKPIGVGQTFSLDTDGNVLIKGNLTLLGAANFSGSGSPSVFNHTIEFFNTNQTFTGSGSLTPPWPSGALFTNNAYTLNFGSAFESMGLFLGSQATILLANGQTSGSAWAFASDSTVISNVATATIASSGFNASYIANAQPTSNNGTISSGSYYGFQAIGRVQALGTGAITQDLVEHFRSDALLVQGAATVTAFNHFRVIDASPSIGGSIGTQTGVLVETLVGATTNVGIWTKAPLHVGNGAQFKINVSGQIIAMGSVTAAATFTAAASFTAAGTALTVTNNATVNGTLTAVNVALGGSGATTTNVTDLATAGTRTYSGAAVGGSHKWIQLTGTDTWAVAPNGFGMFTGIGVSPTLQNDPSVSINLSNVFAIAVGWTKRIDTATGRSLNAGGALADIDYTSAPTYSVVNSGTFTSGEHVSFSAGLLVSAAASTLTAHTGFLSNLGISAGTVTTATHINILDATGGGTLGAQVAIDIAALTKGGTNIGIRNRASTQLGSTQQMNIDTAGSLSTSGSLTTSGTGGLNIAGASVLSGTLVVFGIASFGSASQMSISAAGALATSAALSGLTVAATGLTGATGVTRWGGGTASGAPASGTWAVGDWIIARDGHIWVCTVAGTSGTWVDAGAYGSGTGSPTGSAGGDLTGTYPNPTIAAGAVTLAKQANAAANSFRGNNTGSAATPIDLTVAQAKSLLALAVADVSGAAPTSSPVFTGTVTGATNLFYTDGTFSTATSAGLLGVGAFAGSVSMQLRRANGSAGSETQVLSTQALATLQFQGFNIVSGYLTSAAIEATAEQDFTTAGFRGTKLQFKTSTSSVNTAPLVRVIIDNAGKLYVGSSTSATTSIDQSGNTLLGGTLGVTGATTLAALTATGLVTLGSTGQCTISTAGAIATSNSILSSHPTFGIGYATGAGAAAGAQATSKATTITNNHICGTITFNAAALAANVGVTCTFTNSAIAATDLIIFMHISGGTIGAYTLHAAPGAGTATLTLRNISEGSLSEAPVFAFAVIKAVTS